MRFFQRNIIQYDYKSYPVYFMGNLAYTYADILDLVAKDFGLNIEKTEKSPMQVKKRDELILKNTKYMFSNQKHILYLYEP